MIVELDAGLVSSLYSQIMLSFCRTLDGSYTLKDVGILCNSKATII